MRYIIEQSNLFKQKPLFFIIQDCINQRKVLFSLKVLIGNNFPQFDKSQVSALVELLKLRQNLFLSKLFYEDISGTRTPATNKIELFVIVIASSC